MFNPTVENLKFDINDAVVTSYFFCTICLAKLAQLCQNLPGQDGLIATSTTLFAWVVYTDDIAESPRPGHGRIATSTELFACVIYTDDI